MSDTSDQTPPGQRRRRRFGPLMLLSIAALLLLAFLTFLSVTATPLSLPDWAARGLESRINAQLGTGRVTLNRVQLAVDRNLVPRVRLGDVGVFDGRGTEIAQLNEVGVQLAGKSLMRGEAEINALRLSGAQMTIRRRADGTFDLSFGAGSGTSGTLAGVLDTLDQAFEQRPLSDLSEVIATELTITLEDSRSGRIWQVTEGALTLTQTADSLDLTISADVFNGTEDLAELVIGLSTQKRTPAASITATFDNAAASDIAAQTPALAVLDLLDAPISGALRAAIGADGEFEGLAGTLEIGAGALQPDTGARAIQFDGAQAYMSYDPQANKLSFSSINVASEAARVTATGHALLRDFNSGWPRALVGQFGLSNAALQPEGMFSEPMEFPQGAVDFRLRLDPFRLEIGQAALQNGERRILGAGRVTAEETGWAVALDLSLNTIPLDRLMALWPVDVAVNTRNWLERNISNGDLSDLQGAFRLSPEDEPELSVSFSFQNAVLQYIRAMPPIQGGAGYSSLANRTFTAVLEQGYVVAPDGRKLDVAGTVFRVPDVTARPGRAEIIIRSDGDISSTLGLLDLPPFEMMANAGLGTELAEGRGTLRADVAFDLLPKVELKDVTFDVEGALTDVSSDVLVKDRVISAARLQLRADNDGIIIGGPGRLGVVPANATWSQPFNQPGSGSRVEGTVELGQPFLDEFNIGLPDGSVDGQGIGQFTIELNGEAAPKFNLVSDLNRLGIRIAPLSWSKPRNQTGRLVADGRLGDTPSIDRLELSAPGLDARGVIDLSPSGGLARAQFERVRAGGWLDGPLALIGRGAGRPPAVEMLSGTIDLREAQFGGDGGAGAESGPMTFNLDRLIVSEGIVLTDFRGQFVSTGGFNGQFTARVNGRTPISGAVVPTATGTAVRIRSEDAGRAAASAGVLENARGGELDLTLRPTGQEGVYRGSLRIKNTRIVEAPALTELLSAISIIGLIDQMNSGGITLTDVEGEFQISPRQLTLFRFSGVGPSIGISLDGIYDLANSRMDMQGVISPVYFLNGIGQLFTRRGEGLFGFNFTLKGSAGNPRVNVNPLSILTPGTFREIFRRPPPSPRNAGR